MMHHNLKPKEHKEARFIKAIDSGLHYGVLIPSKVEWMRTFGDDKYYGPMHLWIRCIGTTLRSYFYIETMGEGDYLSTPEERVKMFTNNITLLADGVQLSPTQVENFIWSLLMILLIQEKYLFQF
jgi:hypothetical protein